MSEIIINHPSMNYRVALISLYDERSFGIRSLYAVLKNSGYQAYCIFYKQFTFEMRNSSQRELTILTNLLKELNIDIVGLSVSSTFLKEAIKISSAIREKIGAKLIWGGIHPTLRPEECLKFADFVLQGEAENTLLQVIENLSAQSKINIPGLWFKEEGTIKSGPKTLLATSLDDLPFPDFNQSNKYYIERNTLFSGDPAYNEKDFGKLYNFTYHILSSRGCPFNCSYCSNQLIKRLYPNSANSIRRRSVDNIIAELQMAKERLGVKRISFMDECFGSDKEWLKDFCEKYKTQIALPFYCEMHPAFLTEEAMRLLANAGLRHTSLGIQSGSKQIRESRFNRFLADSAIEEKTVLLRKFNILVHHEIIADNPYETEYDKERTLSLLINLPRPLLLNVFSLNYFPDTDITKMALNDGLISEKDVEGNSDKGLRRFILTRPLNGTDKFWDYIYFIVSDYFSHCAGYPGLRKFFPDSLILKLSKNTILKKAPVMLVIPIETLSKLEIILKKVIKIAHRYSLGNILILLKILVLFSITPFLIAILSPQRLLILLKPKDTKKIVNSERKRKIIKCTNIIMSFKIWHLIKNVCFVRSAVLYFLLSREGLKVKINFGVKKDSGNLKGHSWLTLNEEPYLERKDIVEEFTVIYSE